MDFFEFWIFEVAVDYRGECGFNVEKDFVKVCKFWVSFVGVAYRNCIHLGPCVLKVRTEKGVKSLESVKDGFFNGRERFSGAEGKTYHDLGGSSGSLVRFECFVKGFFGVGELGELDRFVIGVCKNCGCVIIMNGIQNLMSGFEDVDGLAFYWGYC
jgi:hypothetical protein